MPTPKDTPKPFPFKPGDLVMAHFATFSWWPAVVIANHHTTAQNARELKEYKKPGKQYAYVLFMGDRSFGICSSTDLKNLTRDDAFKQSKSKAIKQPKKAAYLDAFNYKKYWDVLLETNLVEPDEKEYTLESIYALPPGVKRSLHSDEDDEEEDDGELENSKTTKKQKKSSTPSKTSHVDEQSEPVKEKKAQRGQRGQKAVKAVKPVRVEEVEKVEKAQEDQDDQDFEDGKNGKHENNENDLDSLKKQAYDFRVHLQKGLIQRSELPSDSVLEECNKHFAELEKFSPKMNTEILRYSKLHKVLKVICRADELQEKKPEYDFRKRSQRLILAWEQHLNELMNEKAKDTPNTTLDQNNLTILKSSAAESPGKEGTINSKSNGTSVKTEINAEKPEHSDENGKVEESAVKSEPVTVSAVDTIGKVATP